MPRHPGPQPAAGQPGHQAFDPLRSSAIAPCCPVMTPCCSAITASRVSRLAWSSPVSIVPLCHNSAPAASAFQPGGGLRHIRRTKSEQLLLGLGLDKGRKICWAARALISGSLDLESLVREPSHRLVTDRLRALHGVGDRSPLRGVVLPGTSGIIPRGCSRFTFTRPSLPGHPRRHFAGGGNTGSDGTPVMPRPSCSWMISPVPTDRAGLVRPALLNRLGNCKYRTVSRAAGDGWNQSRPLGGAPPWTCLSSESWPTAGCGAPRPQP